MPAGTDTDADFLLAETIPNVDEAAVLLELLSAQPKPFALRITGPLPLTRSSSCVLLTGSTRRHGWVPWA